MKYMVYRGRITPAYRSPLRICMQYFLVTRVLSKVEVARLWIACPMTGSSCTILITEVLEFLVSVFRFFDHVVLVHFLGLNISVAIPSITKAPFPSKFVPCFLIKVLEKMPHSFGRKLKLTDLYHVNIGMPTMPFLYAMDFIEVLKKKHASGSYKEMVKRPLIFSSQFSNSVYCHGN